MSLNMLIEFGDAFDYSGADFRKWLYHSAKPTFSFPRRLAGKGVRAKRYRGIRVR